MSRWFIPFWQKHSWHHWKVFFLVLFVYFCIYDHSFCIFHLSYNDLDLLRENVPSVYPQSRLTADKWNPMYILQNPETKAAFRAVPIELRWASWQGTRVLTDWGRQRGTSSLWGPTGARSGGVCGCEAPSHRDYLLLQKEEDTVRILSLATMKAELTSHPDICSPLPLGEM